MAISTTNASARFALRERFANRTKSFGTSLWSDVNRQFQQHADPVYFGDGAPAPEYMPIERMREAAITAYADGPAALSYGDQAGYLPLRELIASRMAERHVDTTADNILVTSGSTHALEIACRVFLEKDDVVIVENPTFLGALELFEMYETQIVSVGCDEHGMKIDELEQVLAEYPDAKAIYTIPTFQNPSGTTLPLERRQRMVELAREHNTVIFEDDPYGELQYSGEAIPPIRSLDEDVIYFGTFSKTIVPGIRMGYVIAPESVIGALITVREVTDVCPDRVSMRTVYHTATDGFLETHVSKMQDVYRSRRDAMLQALDEFMPDGVTWSRPDGGFFVWITLPESARGEEMFDEAARHGVIFFPGLWFNPDKTWNNSLRLSFSSVPEDRIRLGIERLGNAIRAHLA